MRPAKALTRRSLPFPLEFYAGEFVVSYASPEFCGFFTPALVSANIDRLPILRNFHLEGSSDVSEPSLVAPNLECLGLLASTVGDVYHQVPLAKDAPRLKKLELVDCRLSWQSSLYRNLTSLRITVVWL